MFCEEPTTVAKYPDSKTVWSDVKEIVGKIEGDLEDTLKAKIALFGKSEEILLFCNGYDFSSFLGNYIENNASWEEQEEIAVNGGWWYRTGVAFPNQFRDYNVLLITDGVVRNIFVFVKNIS